MKTVEQKRLDLRNMINSEELSFIMEAHDGMSSKIVQETGFQAIWASGLSVSTALGYRDNNELSFSQVADHCYHMARCVDIPVVVDCDTMYGDFNTARVALQCFEKAGVSGIIIEDKVFPKKNSFLNNGKSALADPKEFALKLKAIQDSKVDPNFVVVARVESFLVGNDVNDALMRATIYINEGHADAVLIHSKKSTSEDIDEFMEKWDNKAPVFIVPTKYYTVPADHYREIGINTVIWANHNMRSAITAMRNTSERIYNDESLIGVEDKIITVSDVFKFQGNDELEEAEKKYLPKSGVDTNAIILAASDLPDGTPKTLTKVNGQSIINHQTRIMNEMGITDIIATVNTAIPNCGAYCRANSEYKYTKELNSMKLVSDCIKGDTIITYGDLIFRKHIIQELLDTTSDITIVVDPDVTKDTGYNEYVTTEDKFNKMFYLNEKNKVTSITNQRTNESSGLFIGIIIIKSEKVAKAISFYLTNDILNTNDDRMCDLLTKLIEDGYSVNAKFISSDSWVDVNDIKDIVAAGEIR